MEAAGGDYTQMYDVLKGSSSILFSKSATAPAKLIKQLRKSGSEKPVIKAAYIDSAIFIGDNQLDTLINLKSKEQLVGEIIGLLQSPAKNVISALQSGGNKLAGIVKTLQERG
jgi:large subunit ribosomal protein L10